ncbi:MAG: glycosyltransferase family 61 protein, partial [Rickettsiaceae bacterium]|nr:glycosyltransferase family 61 protein [Rickettsiaceae bacterium]
SRKNSDYRQLHNSNEIEDILVEKGFEIIFPEHLSFFAQVQLFSQAKLIIGQSGAGMANFIFAPKDCKILMMMSDASQTNLHLFGALTQALGLNLEYIIGKSIVVRKKYSIHADFHIDIKLLIDFLDKEGLL